MICFIKKLIGSLKSKEIYNTPSKEADTEQLLKNTFKYANKQLYWYNCRRKKKKFLASLLLSLSIVLLTIALSCLAIKSLGEFSIAQRCISFQQFGFICLAISSGLLLLDKVFGFSYGWTRYMIAELQIEKKLAQFQILWKAVEEDETFRKVEMIHNLEISIRDIIIAETLEWKTDFRTQVKRLGKKVESLLKRTKNELEISQSLGSLIVHFNPKSGFSEIELTNSQGQNIKRTIHKNELSVSFENLNDGICRLHLKNIKYPDGSKDLKKDVVIKSGKIKEESV